MRIAFLTILSLGILGVSAEAQQPAGDKDLQAMLTKLAQKGLQGDTQAIKVSLQILQAAQMASERHEKTKPTVIVLSETAMRL